MPDSVLRDHGLSDLIVGEVETIASGFVFTEGPLWLPNDSLLFQDIKSEKTYRVGPEGTVEVLRDHTRAANGQTFDSLGGIIFCEQNGRRISRMNRDGSGVTIVVETFEGKRLNSPNDVICDRQGRILFTDPPYGVPTPADKELPFQGVFRLSPDLKQLELLIADDFEKPNGLALSPDERTLYVCDTAKYHVRAFDLNSEGQIDRSSSRVFATMDPGQPGGPDGMKVDRAGRVYVAVALGVWVYEPDGTLLGILSLPKRPSNLAWSGQDSQTLAITMVDSVCRLRMAVAGVVPPFRD
jgi:gluconolactonase